MYCVYCGCRVRFCGSPLLELIHIYVKSDVPYKACTMPDPPVRHMCVRTRIKWQPHTSLIIAEPRNGAKKTSVTKPNTGIQPDNAFHLSTCMRTTWRKWCVRRSLCAITPAVCKPVGKVVQPTPDKTRPRTHVELPGVSMSYHEGVAAIGLTAAHRRRPKLTAYTSYVYPLSSERTEWPQAAISLKR